MAHKMASMDEFTALEQECNAITAMDLKKDDDIPNRYKKKKLFDSDTESDEDDVQQNFNTQSNARASPKTHPESRSNIVKKMFYKEETTEKKSAYHKRPAESNND